MNDPVIFFLLGLLLVLVLAFGFSLGRATAPEGKVRVNIKPIILNSDEGEKVMAAISLLDSHGFKVGRDGPA